MERVFLASTMIIVPGPERAAYGAPRADGRARDDLRTAGVAGIRPSPDRAADWRTTDSQTTAAYDSDRLPRTVYSEPRGSLPFLAQQLAQEGTPDDLSPIAVASDEAPQAIRMSALRAYGVAQESTIEFLSPTTFYDVRV